MVDVGNRLRTARVDKGWSQKDFADKASCSQPQTSQIETGKLEPADALREKLAKVLKVDLPSSGASAAAAKAWETRRANQ